MNDPLVSIIILSFNNLQYLDELLNSIEILNYPNMEIILADDGSIEFNYQEIKKKLNSIQSSRIQNIIIKHERSNVGTVLNINKALDLSHGEIIKLIAVDDSFHDAYSFAKAIRYLSENNLEFLATKVETCNSLLEPINSNTKYNISSSIATMIDNHEYDELFYRHCTYGIKPPAPGFFFTKKCFIMHGKFDEDYIIAEDSPMWCRLLREEAKIGYLDLITVKYRIGDGISTNGKLNRVLINDQIKKIEKEILTYKKKLPYYTVRINKYRYKKLKYKLENKGTVDLILLMIRYLDVIITTHLKIFREKNL